MRTTICILRVIWATLLAILLAAGIFVQAPWKVIAFIVIFLAAVTILPRIYRRWFWIAVGLAFAIFVGWVLAPTDHEGWEPYKYDFSSQLVKLEHEREIPPAENAAPDYLALLKENAADDANLTDQFCKVYNSPWKSSDYPDAAKSLEKHSQTIKKLMDISQKPECRFALGNPNDELNTTKYAASGRWADLLAAACNNDVGEGRLEQALEKSAAIVQIGRHQIQQGTRIDMMLGMGIKSLAYAHARPLIMNGLDEEEISRAQSTICAPDNDWEGAWSRMLEYDKLIGASEVMAYYEINQNGRIRLSRDPDWPMRIRMRKTLNESYSPEPNEHSIWYKQLLKPLIYRIAYPSWPETKLIKASTFIRWLCLPASPDDSFAFNKKRSIFSKARAQDRMYESMLQKHKYSMADRKGTLLMIALKRYKDAHGNWPENLAEIKSLASPDTFIDPLNNGEFVYKLTKDGFALYSKGKNGIDEEGQFSAKHDDWMIWPEGKTAKTEQEKTDAEQQ